MLCFKKLVYIYIYQSMVNCFMSALFSVFVTDNCQEWRYFIGTKLIIRYYATFVI